MTLPISVEVGLPGSAMPTNALSVLAVDESRGETAFVFRIGAETLAFVQECLGPKSLIARDWELASELVAFPAPDDRATSRSDTARSNTSDTTYHAGATTCLPQPWQCRGRGTGAECACCTQHRARRISCGSATGESSTCL